MPPGPAYSGVSRAALKYVATAKIMQLAKPKGALTTEINKEKNCFRVKLPSLKYKASPRILLLAQPKTRKE